MLHALDRVPQFLTSYWHHFVILLFFGGGSLSCIFRAFLLSCSAFAIRFLISKNSF